MRPERNRRARLLRWAAVVVAGGMVLQVGACATALSPTLLGLVENVLLSLLFGGALGV
jgi:hypothetical protein